jgi:DNA-directed RNA polymerase specialized sigma subunit
MRREEALIVNSSRQILEACRNRYAWYDSVQQALFDAHSRLDGLNGLMISEYVSTSPEFKQNCEDLMYLVECKQLELNQRMKESLELIEQAKRVIDKISNPRWQDVLSGYYIEQLGWQELAKKLNTTDSAVKMLHARAIEHLNHINIKS